MSFGDRLEEAIERAGNPCVVGIDPHLELLPEEFATARDPRAPPAERAAEIARFGRELVDAVAGRAGVVKPQSAFFEIFGSDGVRALEETVAHARAAGLVVIGDVKRCDIASTARAYASAHLAPIEGLDGRGRFDAITISPYLGRDSIDPFLAACREADAGIFVLVRTSNPGSADLQERGDPPLYEAVADLVGSLGESLVGERGLSSVGAVVGATRPEALAALRSRLPRTPFLLPGYGAQGAGADETAAAFLPGGRGAIVNSSRGIAFAYRDPRRAGRSWKDAAREALAEMAEEINAARGR